MNDILYLLLYLHIIHLILNNTSVNFMCRKIPVLAFGEKVQLNRYLPYCKKNCRG